MTRKKNVNGMIWRVLSNPILARSAIHSIVRKNELVGPQISGLPINGHCSHCRGAGVGFIVGALLIVLLATIQPASKAEVAAKIRIAAPTIGEERNIYLLHIPSSLRKCPAGRQNRCDRQLHKGHIQLFITLLSNGLVKNFSENYSPPCTYN